MTKSNKWDATGDVLLVIKRVEATSEHQRITRSYIKKKAQYWDHEILEKKAKHKETRMGNSPQRETSIDEIHTDQINTEQMSPAELREELKSLGIVTRVRKLSRLQEMYQDALKQVE